MFQILGDAFFWLFVIVNLSALATLALSVMRWAATVLVFAILFSATLVAVSARFVLPVSGIRQWGGLAAFRSNVGRPWTLRRVGADKFGSDILATFSDGVFAIIVTILVLQFKAQHDDNWRAVWGLARIFSSYMLSFLFIAIYWTNHHDLMQSVTKLNAKIFWANTNLLFWLALIPFTTAWMTESFFDCSSCGLWRHPAGLRDLLLPPEEGDHHLRRREFDDRDCCQRRRQRQSHDFVSTLLISP